MCNNIPHLFAISESFKHFRIRPRWGEIRILYSDVETSTDKWTKNALSLEYWVMYAAVTYLEIFSKSLNSKKDEPSSPKVQTVNQCRN